MTQKNKDQRNRMKNYAILIIIGIMGVSSITIAYSYIPPTNAFEHITTSNDTIYATDYFSNLNIVGLGNATVTGSNDSKTVYINVSTHNGRNGTTITPLTCTLDSQLHSVDASGVFTCAPNNSTGGSANETLDTLENVGTRHASIYAGNSSNTNFQIKGLENGTGIQLTNNTNNIILAINFKINGYTCPANSAATSFDNSTGETTCTTLASLTLDTMQNVGNGQGSFYAGNSSNTNFKFKTLNVTGSSLSLTNGTNSISIHGNTYQNNTGSNLGSHGIGVFSSMNNAILQFFSVLSANNQLSIVGNSTNILFTIQHVITDAFKSNTVTCAVGSFFSAFDNSTGTYTCTAGATGTVSNIKNIGHGGKGFLASISSGRLNGKNLTSTRIDNFLSVSNNATDVNLKSNFTAPTFSGQVYEAVNYYDNDTRDGPASGFGFIKVVTGINTADINGFGMVDIIRTKGNTTVTNATIGTGHYTVKIGTGDHVVMIDGSNQTITKGLVINQGKLGGNLNVGGKALTLNGHQSLLPATSGTLCQTNQTSACGTSSGANNTGLNVGKGTGSYGPYAGMQNNFLKFKNDTAGRNVNIYTNTTDIKISANNTAYAENIYSTKGTTQIAGQQGLFKNNTNATMINLKTIASINPFNQIGANGTNVMINGSVPTTNVIDIYDQTIGDYSTPSSATNSSACCGTSSTTTLSVTNGSTTTHTTGWQSNVYLQKYVGLTSGDSITQIGVNVQTAAGNIRVKVYQDDGSNGLPSTLLGESGSNSVPGTGIRNFTLTSSATIPASGKVWVGFETDSSSLDLKYNNVGTAVECNVAHTYGAGPSPYGTCTRNTVFDFKYYITYTHSATTTTHPASKAVDGNTATYWESLGETNPWIYVDTGSAQILSGAAMFWNSSSTSTQILVQTSTDASTWNTKRTVNTNLLTNNAWNYIRWDLDGSTERYVRFYGNDGTSKQLSFYELKVLIPSSTTLLLRHGHEFIDSTNATLPLNR